MLVNSLKLRYPMLIKEKNGSLNIVKYLRKKILIQGVPKFTYIKSCYLKD